MIQLRPYQQKLIDEARVLMSKGVKSILLQAPTGSGKTALTAKMLHTAQQKGMASFFVVHRRELIKQSTAAFALEGLKHGIIAAGFQEDRRHLVQIASVQTLARRYSRYRQPRLVVWDECHHVAAGAWSKLFQNFPSAFHIGLSATPERLDGRGLSAFFKEMLHGPSVEWLIQNKFLSDYRLYAPSKISMAGVHIRMGDFIQAEVSDIVDKPGITGDVIAHYRKYCHGKRAVVFCVSVMHSKHVADQFNAAGINAAHVDGETPQEERDGIIRKFREGNLQILSNVELFGEGFDVPSIEASILLRPTQSLGLYLQQVGRALRPADGKTHAILLDHVGNCERHGLPDDNRTWNLEGRGDRKGLKAGANSSVKICPKCFACQLSGNPVCKFCGQVFDKQPREIDQKEGELSEIDKEAIRRQRAREQGAAPDRDALLALAKRRGYRVPHAWVHFVMQARQAKKLRGELA